MWFLVKHTYSRQYRCIYYNYVTFLHQTQTLTQYWFSGDWWAIIYDTVPPPNQYKLCVSCQIDGIWGGGGMKPTPRHWCSYFLWWISPSDLIKSHSGLSFMPYEFLMTREDKRLVFLQSDTLVSVSEWIHNDQSVLFYQNLNDISHNFSGLHSSINHTSLIIQSWFLNNIEKGTDIEASNLCLLYLLRYTRTCILIIQSTRNYRVRNIMNILDLYSGCDP